MWKFVILLKVRNLWLHKYNLSFHLILDTVKIFKFITYFVGVPLLGVAMVNCYIKILEESHEPAPEFIHYPYMKVMNKVRFK